MRDEGKEARLEPRAARRLLPPSLRPLLMRVLLSLLAVSLVLPTAAAQRHRFAQHGDLALVIGVSGLEDLALRPYEGGIGFRYRAADQTVIGAAVALNLQESDVAHRNESGDLPTYREKEDSGSRSNGSS